MPDRQEQEMEQLSQLLLEKTQQQRDSDEQVKKMKETLKAVQRDLGESQITQLKLKKEAQEARKELKDVQAIAKDRIHMMKTTIQELRDENMLLLSQPRAEEPPEDEDEEEEEEDEELPGTTGDPFKDALLVGLSPKKQKEKLRVHAAVLSGMGAEEKLVKILQDKQKVEKFFEEAFESSAWSVGGLKPNKWGPILQIENEREQMREERIGHRTQLLAEQNKARMLERRIAELESAGAKPNNIASPPDLYDIASPAPPNEQVLPPCADREALPHCAEREVLSVSLSRHSPGRSTSSLVLSHAMLGGSIPWASSQQSHAALPSAGYNRRRSDSSAAHCDCDRRHGSL